MFWTVAFPSDSVSFDGDLGVATLRATDLHVVDAVNLANALAGGPSVPAVVSFEATWTAAGPFEAVRDEANGFMGDFRLAEANVSWSGSTDRSSYASDVAGTSKPVYGVIGRERNGRFFS